MWRFIKSIFAWRQVRDTGVWVYYENTVTGERQTTWTGWGHQPLDTKWLKGGKVNK